MTMREAKAATIAQARKDERVLAEMTFEQRIAAVRSAVSRPQAPYEAFEQAAREDRSCRIYDTNIAGVPSVILEPANGSKAPLLLYLHGGGFWGGHPWEGLPAARIFARELGARVVMPEYTLSLDKPYPAAVLDCAAVYRELAQRSDPLSMMVGGTSAGANLTIALLLHLRDHGCVMPRCAYAVSGIYDMTLATLSRQNAASDCLTLLGLEDATTVYDGSDGTKLLEPYASPLFGSLEGLCPVLLAVADDEMLLGDTLALDRAMKAAGAAVQTHVISRVYHGFNIPGDLFEESAAIHQRICSFYRDAGNPMTTGLRGA